MTDHAGRQRRCGVARYRMGAHCANCDEPFVILQNGTDLGREASQIPTILASCTCVVVAYAPARVQEVIHAHEGKQEPACPEEEV